MERAMMRLVFFVFEVKSCILVSIKYSAMIKKLASSKYLY